MCLYVGETKNDDARTFPLTPDLRACLEAQRAATDAIQRKKAAVVPWVFHRNGRPIKDMYKAWRQACRDSGCPDRIPHDFRRTAVRNLVRAGVPERVAMQMTGHKTRSVFERYNIVSDADLTAAAEKLAMFESGATGTSHGTRREKSSAPRLVTAGV